MNASGIKITVLPSARLFDEREYGIVHTPYEIETAFYSSIGRGNVEEMQSLLQKLLESGIVAGKLSSDNIRQMQYWAVCCIALATRYAIAGGLDENKAFNYSDECVLKIDSMSGEKEIFDFLIEKSTQLTMMVNRSRYGCYPKAVRKCLQIINSGLFQKLSLTELAKECGVSKDYLSQLFKNNIGITIPQYIKKERLEASKELLKNGMPVSQIAYTVGFTTESYYIKCFKDEYGVTPLKYADK